MIHELCNIGNENNIDTFYKIVIYEATQFINFDRFTSDEALEAILTNLPDSAQVLFADLLPENISVSSSTAIKNGLTAHNNSIQFAITPQTKDRQTVLKTYNNKQVFVLLIKHETQHLYGTSKEPLLFKFDELHNNRPGALKGFTLSIGGSTTEDSRYLSVDEFNIYSRTLAFKLASKI